MKTPTESSTRIARVKVIHRLKKIRISSISYVNPDGSPEVGVKAKRTRRRKRTT